MFTHVSSFANVVLGDDTLFLGDLDELAGEALEAPRNLLSVSVNDGEGLVSSVESPFADFGDILLGADAGQIGRIPGSNGVLTWGYQGAEC